MSIALGIILILLFAAGFAWVFLVPIAKMETRGCATVIVLGVLGIAALIALAV